MTHEFWSLYFRRPVPLWIGWKLEVANFFLTYAAFKRYADSLLAPPPNRGPTVTASGQVFWAARDCIDAWKDFNLSASAYHQDPHCATCTCFEKPTGVKHGDV